MPRVLSVNVGLPRVVSWRGRQVRTSIRKEPTEGRIAVRRLNLDGDAQSDLTVHGGLQKAVYLYPSEHYAFWKSEIPDIAFSYGAFGENLTTAGILEQTVMIGDRFRIGSAEFAVTQPRTPCFKLGIRFDRDDMVRRFLHSRRVGLYLEVLREGDVAAGDDVELITRGEGSISVADVTELYATDSGSQDLLHRAANTNALPESWRDYFRNRLWKPDR